MNWIVCTATECKDFHCCVSLKMSSLMKNHQWSIFYPYFTQCCNIIIAIYYVITTGTLVFHRASAILQNDKNWNDKFKNWQRANQFKMHLACRSNYLHSLTWSCLNGQVFVTTHQMGSYIFMINSGKGGNNNPKWLIGCSLKKGKMYKFFNIQRKSVCVFMGT